MCIVNLAVHRRSITLDAPQGLAGEESHGCMPNQSSQPQRFEGLMMSERGNSLNHAS
jgi:hypothetical protein